MSRRPREEIDNFTPMDLEQLQLHLNTQSELLREAKMRRNFVQQERELINSYYEISQSELEKIKKEIEGVLSNRNPEMKVKIVTF